MADDKRDGHTRELIAEAERLRSQKDDKKNPSTRQLVRDAEQLIGRQVPAGAASSLKWALGLALLAAVVGALYFVFGA